MDNVWHYFGPPLVSKLIELFGRNEPASKNGNHLCIPPMENMDAIPSRKARIGKLSVIRGRNNMDGSIELPRYSSHKGALS
jgi:hypothetical protein